MRRAEGSLRFVHQKPKGFFAIDALHLPVKDTVSGLPRKDYFSSGSILEVTTDPTQPVMAGMPAHAKVFVDQIPCPVVLIASNGARIGSPSGEVFHRNFLRRHLARGVLEDAWNFRQYAVAIFDTSERGQVIMEESAVPVREPVRGVCELLGLDPLYVANEGKLLAVVAREDAPRLLDRMRERPEAREARVIGEVVEDPDGLVVLKTRVGGRRIVDMLPGEQLPRIC